MGVCVLASETIQYSFMCCVPSLPPDGAGLTGDGAVWIGLSVLDYGRGFQWSDGTALDYKGWVDEGRKNNGGILLWWIFFK